MSAMMTTLDDLLLDQLSELYNVERVLTHALPKMMKGATHPALQRAFEAHLKQTEGHVLLVEEVFESLGKTPMEKTSLAIQGLVQAGAEAIKANATDAVKDAGLIAAGQRVEHYEMAGYGCVRQYAKQLGHTRAVELIDQIFKEEAETDASLTKLAEEHINVLAEGRAVEGHAAVKKRAAKHKA